MEDELEQARRDPLASPALATASTDLIEPCSVTDPRAGAPAPTQGTPLALAFSGGGFRASLSCLGVLRFLADAGLLHRVRYASSVSGGSVANGLFAHRYADLEEQGFTAETLDEIVIEPLIELVSSQSLSK